MDRSDVWKRLGAVATSLAMSSCSSPPRLPTADESNRRPANEPTAVELQVCKSALRNARLQAEEHLAQPGRGNGRGSPEDDDSRANVVYPVLFQHGSSAVQVPLDLGEQLLRDVRDAPLVLLRGRTDGARETPAESRIARQRAEALRTYLVKAGVSPTRIRATYQPVGDHAADNTTTGGRALNRRVEIELYRALPETVPAAAPRSPARESKERRDG
jgi:outer membrane protein OmpA-like peptidoglycan-associated protein